MSAPLFFGQRGGKVFLPGKGQEFVEVVLQGAEVWKFEKYTGQAGKDLPAKLPPPGVVEFAAPGPGEVVEYDLAMMRIKAVPHASDDIGEPCVGLSGHPCGPVQEPFEHRDKIDVSFHIAFP